MDAFPLMPPCCIQELNPSLALLLVTHASFLPMCRGMDTMARGLRNAARLLEEGVVERMRAERYSSWRDTKLGRWVSKC